jgi:DNA-binding HxlR family transcriptional regulator
MRARTRPQGTTEDSSTDVASADAEEIRAIFRSLERRGSALIEGLPEARSPVRDPAEDARWRIEAMRELHSKWSTEILITLYTLGAVRFEELRRKLEGISARVLSGRLKMLEARRLIERRVVDDRPPRVEYRLSEDGELLVRLGDPALWFLRARSMNE